MSMRTYIYNRRLKVRSSWLLWLVALLLPVAAYMYWWYGSAPIPVAQLPTLPSAQPAPGSVLGEDAVKPYTLAETVALAKENYGAQAQAVTTPVTKITFRYRSELPSGDPITIYGRAYLPDNPRTNLPIFAFAPGTTGIGDKCAPSLEDPKVANWGDYDSHMAMYASQGFAAVTTDYEGMRDPGRIHHYMVGELEGRAMLDSVRALRRLPEARGRLNQTAVFLGGYSQGGHAAFWADKVAARYSPDVKPLGVVGFGPVMSVSETLTDVTHGANINWFGPYVLYSYSDYYQGDYGSVLLPKWEDAQATDVPAHCIDTDIVHWGKIPANVYTPEFLTAATAGQLATAYPNLSADLDRNAVGPLSTSSAKRINEGALDNVVLPAQQQAVVPDLCRSSTGPVEFKLYPTATHYSTMLISLPDTLAWMRAIVAGQTLTASCQ
jgi:hypothetical protein